MTKLSPDQFIPFLVTQTTKVSPTVTILRMSPAAGDKIDVLPVCYSLSIANDTCTEQRPYTPINYITDYTKPLEHLDVLVRQYPGGIISGFLAARQPGDLVNIRGPFIKVDIDQAICQHDRLGLIAGGTGITPMLQIIRYVLTCCSKTVMTLLFGNTSDSEVLLKTELDILAINNSERFKVYYAVGSEITEEMITSTMPGPKDPQAMLYMCGPPPMMKALGGGGRKEALGGTLASLGYTRVHKY